MVTDCSALRHTLTQKNINPRIARWWLLIQDFEFTVEYRPGTAMRHVDALSPNPVLPITDRDTDSAAERSVVVCRTMGIDLDDWVRIAQEQDTRCTAIKEAIITNQPNAQQKEDKQNYILKRDRVYRRTEGGLRWVVPHNTRAQILKMVHDNNGHPGLTKTEELLKLKYWFPKMKKYAADYVQACLNCLYAKPNRGISSGPLHPIKKPSEPM